ncbi:MAG TPA: TetR/AcrR family transcriptional regulator [Patescibacteria group bacterium]|nr:TetR/AcrR family transcriptional regulator [Patescibacteria group bacterium]
MPEIITGKDHRDKETRARIITKANEVFLKMGFSKVTMDELANDLGMSKKTLYKHFSSKDDLLRAMMTEFRCEVHDYIDSCMCNTEIDFVEKLKRIMVYVSEQMAKVSTPFAEDMRRNAPELWKEMEKFRHEHGVENFTKLLREGIQAGIFRSDINEYLIAMIYINSAQSLVNPAILTEIPFTASEVFTAIKKVVFQGILTDEGRKRVQ